jgi:hypothetical protein
MTLRVCVCDTCLMALAWRKQDGTSLVIIHARYYAHIARKYLQLTKSMNSMSLRIIVSAKLIDGLKNYSAPLNYKHLKKRISVLIS